MTEEDAFWALVGIAKAFNNFFVFDFKEPKDNLEVQFEHFNPIISRKMSLKNEMNILTCLIRIHLP